MLEACKNGLLKRFKHFFEINLDSVEVSEAIKTSFSIPKFKLKWINNLKSHSKADLNEDQILKLIIDTICTDFSMTEDLVLSNPTCVSATKEDEFFEFDDITLSTTAENMDARKKKKLNSVIPILLL